MNYKNTETEQVISESCYFKLPEEKRYKYIEVEDEPTHYYEDVDRSEDNDDGFLISAIETVAIDSILDSSNDSSFDSNDVSFGGGSFDGGGSVGSW